LTEVWIWYNIKREMDHFITIRQHHLISPRHAMSVQATTVLVTGIPANYLSEPALLELYNHLPGGVKKIWLNRCPHLLHPQSTLNSSIYTYSNLKELPEVYDRHTEAADKLENAENALLKTAAKLRAKKLKKAAKKSDAAVTTGTLTTDAEGRPLTHPSTDDPESNVSLAAKLVPQKKRPTHRLPLSFMPFALPFIGKKVDSIDWARDEIVTTNELLAKGRALIDSQDTFAPHSSDADSTVSNDNTALSHEYPVLNSAFITFNLQIAAHLAKTGLNHHKPYRITGRYTEVAPEDIIWSNLGMNAYEEKGRMLISYAATAGLVVLWAFPGELTHCAFAHQIF
jgi:hypothetical protein